MAPESMSTADARQAASIVPPVLTCLVGRRLGDDPSSLAHYPLRDLAASLLSLICRKYGNVSPTLRPRLARTCLKHFLDPNKPLGVHYGAIIGLDAVGGAEVVRALVLPNIKAYETVLADHVSGEDGDLSPDATMVVGAIIKTLTSLEEEEEAIPMLNGDSGSGGEELKKKLEEKLGSIVGGKVYNPGRLRLVYAVVR